MEKAIDLQAQIATQGNPQQALAALKQAFTDANPGMQLTVKDVEDSGAQTSTVKVYIEGEQPAPRDFEATATVALQRAINSLQNGLVIAGAGAPGISNIVAVENSEEDEDVILPPPAIGPAAAHVTLGVLPPRSRQRPPGVSSHTPHPRPPRNTFNDCPSNGDGGDPKLNVRKNRTDAGDWIPLSVDSILRLDWPQGVERKDHSNWTKQEKAEVARFEGIAVQVEGFLAGLKVEGEESCNCHSKRPVVDYHMWLVADEDTAQARDLQNDLDGRALSVVAEVTPRIRAAKPEMNDQLIRPLVTDVTKVRLSGWLLLDQAHPEQLGDTRGTLWEIHPIVEFEVMKNGQWVALGS